MLKRHSGDASRFVFVDDFGGAAYDQNAWSASFVGAGSLRSLAVLGGVVELVAPSTSDSARLAFGSGAPFSLAKNAVVRWRVRVPIVTNVRAYCGLYFSSGGTNGVWWQLDTSVSPNWYAATYAAGAPTLVNSGVTANTNWHDFYIVTSSAQAQFFLDGVLLATISTTLPSVDLSLVFYTEALTASQRTAQADYVEAEGVRA